MSLHIVVLKNFEGTTIPAYIGKTINPWQRWNNDHLKKLRQSAINTEKSSYTRWINLFERIAWQINFICISESEIKFPPIPGFPATV